MQTIHNPASKVARHRERMRTAGYRPVQFWVLDTRSTELADLLRRQCRSLRGDQAEADAIGFGKAAASLIKDWK